MPSPGDEEEMEERNGRKGANEERKRKGGRNEKGYKKAEEFKKYLEGERSARDPRFDLKIFQYVQLYLFPSLPLSSASPFLRLACPSSRPLARQCCYHCLPLVFSTRCGKDTDE